MKGMEYIPKITLQQFVPTDEEGLKKGFLFQLVVSIRFPVTQKN